MPFALPFPDIDPVLVSFELFGVTLALRWYALAYIAGLLIGWQVIVALCRRPASGAARRRCGPRRSTTCSPGSWWA
jgi:prolipoprotein diacylglyceryltransferase